MLVCLKFNGMSSFADNSHPSEGSANVTRRERLSHLPCPRPQIGTLSHALCFKPFFLLLYRKICGQIQEFPYSLFGTRHLSY